ncbi:cation:proton antiporter [Gordonia sp. VNK21]|uniref:cation:proton antiporter n=1 Tax=Gordonia sp. VNK21 TaxID=3382483 RepID=UPI0038D357FA
MTTVLAGAEPEPVPFIGSEALLVLLVQLAVLLAAAVAAGALARRIGVPAVVGELLAGVLLGPSLLGHAWPAAERWLFPSDPAQQNLADAIGQLGVILLVGLAGAEVDIGFVRRQRRVVASISVFAFIIPFAAGVGAALLIPASMRVDGASTAALAMMMGTALSVSAIPVIAKILAEMGYLHRNVGQFILASASANDAFAWILLSITASLATVGVRTGDIAVSIGATVGVFLVGLLILRPLVRPLLDRCERAAPAVLIPVCTVLILAAAALTQALGLEAILGAFVAGLIIGPRTPALIGPLTTVTMAVLVPVFLATAGLRVDLTLLADPVIAAVAVGTVAAAAVSKFTGAYLGARLARQTRWEAAAIGAGLNSRGAVEIVIAMTGLRIGVLSAGAYTVVVIVAIATSIMAPPLLKRAMRQLTATEEELVRQELRTPV